MKKVIIKFFAILCLTSLFISCNNESEWIYIFDELAQIVSKQREESPSNDPCEFTLHAYDIFYGIVEDYKNNNDEDDSLKDLIKE